MQKLTLNKSKNNSKFKIKTKGKNLTMLKELTLTSLILRRTKNCKIMRIVKSNKINKTKWSLMISKMKVTL